MGLHVTRQGDGIVAEQVWQSLGASPGHITVGGGLCELDLTPRSDTKLWLPNEPD